MILRERPGQEFVVVHGASGRARLIPVRLLDEADCDAVLASAGGASVAWARLNDFRAKPGELLIVPDGEGAIARVLFGLGPRAPLNPMALRGLSARLPPGDYALEQSLPDCDLELAALAFALGAHRFDRYKADPKRSPARLVVNDGVDLAATQRVARACALARDMVDTPASDMGPMQIETISRNIAEANGGRIDVVAGDALLAAGYPAVHAVGRAAAADRAPRMIELHWRGSGAAEDAPLIAVVGKGVTFDTGGLDMKTSSGMRLMKKDMGGAAHALALGQLIMQADLPVRVVVLAPLVENAISGDAMRPSDVIATRSGLSVEVGNTDAEGRLILADALGRAGELSPALTIDLATLTGAARVALGPEVIPFYTANDALADGLTAASRAVWDPLWRMPLWSAYAAALNSDIADLKNDPDVWAQAGSVTAALFLQRFAPKSGSWVHLDIFAWNPRGRPGWPAGGEAQAIRALFALIQARYGVHEGA